MSDSSSNFLLHLFSTVYFPRALRRKDLSVPGLKILRTSRLLSKAWARVSKPHVLCKNTYFFLPLKEKDKFLRLKHIRSAQRQEEEQY